MKENYEQATDQENLNLESYSNLLVIKEMQNFIKTHKNTVFTN